jgi:sortase A
VKQLSQHTPGWIEAGCWLASTICLGAFAVSRADSAVARKSGVEAFQAHLPAGSPIRPDRGLWSAQRMRAYDTATHNTSDIPEGVLRIPAVRLEVPIYAGTSTRILDRGAGRIEGTAALDAAGNVGLAAHRDGFFRVLKDITVGDALFVDTPAGTRRYRVVDLAIVAPDAVGVLAPTAHPSVTLVTCYPFYYVGPAPQRFIVRAELTRDEADRMRHTEAGNGANNPGRRVAAIGLH